MFVPLLVLVAAAAARNYAVLVNTSKNYSNYRHMADLLALRSILAERGFEPADIVALFREDPVQNARNPHGERIVFYGGEAVGYTRLEPSALDDGYLMNTLLLRHERLKRVDCGDNLLVFICGHGKNGFLKICGMYYLFRGDIMRVLAGMCRRASKVLLIIDTCRAESLVDRGSVPGNAFVVTTSLAHEDAYSIGVDRTLGVTPMDAFPYELRRMGLAPRTRLVDLFAEVKRRIADSTLTYSQKEEFLVGDFFVQSGEEPAEVRGFVL